MPEIAPELAQRLLNYGLEGAERTRLRDLRPLVEPLIEPALDRVIAGARHLPHVAHLWREHGAELRRIEFRQFSSLLSAEFDARYVETCWATVERETELGFESRARINCGAKLIERAGHVLGRGHRMLGGAERVSLLARAIMFDTANTSTYFLQISERQSATRRKSIDEAVQDFGRTTADVMAAIKETSTSLTAISSVMQRAAEDTLKRMVSASTSSANITKSVDLTVAATGELADSIRAIGRETTRGLEMARSAVSETERTEKTVRGLNEAAGRIGSVVEIISNIASQTNLLALNATIEASRAGEVGRGFAVVATEVKALANQTSRATEEISRHIASVQEATGLAVTEIASVAGSIGQLAEAATRIAASVEEQESVTRSISGSIQSVAGDTASASDEMRSVEKAAGQNAATADEIARWTRRLTSGAQDLETKVTDFFARVRAAQ